MRWVNGVCKDKPKKSSKGLFTQAYLRLNGSNKFASFHEIFVKTGEGRGREGKQVSLSIVASDIYIVLTLLVCVQDEPCELRTLKESLLDLLFFTYDQLHQVGSEMQRYIYIVLSNVLNNAWQLEDPYYRCPVLPWIHKSLRQRVETCKINLHFFYSATLKDM